jgi:hypothetical protein
MKYPVEELEKLGKFLEPESVYFNGHPNDADVIALREALEHVRVHGAVKTALAVIQSAVSDGGWFMLVLKDHQTQQEFKDALSWCERLAAFLNIKEHGVAQMPDMAAGQHAEIAHMRGLLSEMGRLRAGNAQTGGLSHLGAHHTGLWSRAWGYDYSMPLVIKQGGAMIGDWTTVYWKRGKSLKSAIADKKNEASWVELKDDQGNVYYHNGYRRSELADISVLQLEIEKNPNSERTLFLKCNADSSGGDWWANHTSF